MKRTTSAPDLLLRLDRAIGVPLRVQLQQELRAAIRTGRLRRGAQVPSSRAFAADLGVSRGLVVEAYEQLLAEGYLVSRQGAATTVAARRLDTGRSPERPAGPAVVRPRYDFRPGTPDLATFPRRAWLGSLRRLLADAPPTVFAYPDSRGTATARAAVADYLNRARGAVADPGRVILCTGFTQGFHLLCQALRARGATSVAIEDPSQVEQRDAIAASGMKAIPIAVDRCGLLVDRLERTKAAAVAVTPAHQFPTGSVLAPERRAALIGWAERHQALVIEDDYDAEYRYDREPIGSLQGMAPEHVAYVGTASKTLAPTLRLGWLVLPADFVPRVTQLKRSADLASPGIDQLAYADFISHGELDRHLRRMRTHYRKKRDLLVTTLSTRLPDLTVSGIAAGLHLMLELGADANEQATVESAARHSVGVLPVGAYRARARLPPALVLSYGSIAEGDIAEGVARLAAAIEHDR